MKRSGFILISALLFFNFSFLLGANSNQGLEKIKNGITFFQNEAYDKSLQEFREVILNTTLQDYHADAYYWITRIYLASGQNENASKSIEFFLSNYRNHPLYPELYYQKGRILFLQEDYENSILLFKSFIDSFPESPFVPNSFFWIGEALYFLGHYDEAYKIFSLVVQNFPTSFKYETAQYRISLLDLKRRENELLQLLKISHEEYLSLLDEFQRKEKGYEQAILEYQRKLSSFASQDLGSQILKLSQDLALKDGQIETLKAENNTLKKNLNEALTTVKQSTAQETPQIQPLPISSEEQIVELLRLKSQALTLKEYYLDWLLKKMERGR